MTNGRIDLVNGICTKATKTKPQSSKEEKNNLTRITPSSRTSLLREYVGENIRSIVLSIQVFLVGQEPRSFLVSAKFLIRDLPYKISSYRQTQIKQLYKLSSIVF
jgi:hypothetical protein